MIVDSFMFFNAPDVLEIRLREFDAVVDRWVVVESSVTHQGQPKASCFRDHRERFAPWNDRIVSVIVEPQGQTPREREAAQRPAIRVGLWPAVEEFLAQETFRLRERYDHNNGFTVRERGP